MNEAPVKTVAVGPRLAKRPSTTIHTNPTYRVSKTQSLRMRAHDQRIEAAEAKKAKAAAEKQATADKKPNV
jgi:hypothetical protein